MPKLPISISQDPSGAWNLQPTDYQTLLSSLLLSTNPDGTIVQITLTAVVYNAIALEAQDQAIITAEQTKLATDTAAAQDINP